MRFDDEIESLASETAFWMMALRADDHPIEHLGRVGLEVGDRLRALGIMLLLARGDAIGMHRNLLWSGWARRRYLERAAQAGAFDDHHFVAGRPAPLLDAIAAGGIELAGAIDRLAPDAWRRGHEYEDEFAYARALALLAHESPPPPAFDALLERIAEASPPARAVRADLCAALRQSDQAAFDAAMDELIDQRQSEIAAERERGRLETPLVLAERSVFVEGLALLHLAERRGLQTGLEVPLCPSLARVRGEPVELVEP